VTTGAGTEAATAASATMEIERAKFNPDGAAVEMTEREHPTSVNNCKKNSNLKYYIHTISLLKLYYRIIRICASCL
jgi:hypothetical protein